jgi:hypothetical protein
MKSDKIDRWIKRNEIDENILYISNSIVCKIMFVVVKGPPIIAVGFNVARYGLVVSASGKTWPV